MNGPSKSPRAFPIEDVVQSLSSQLDRAQDGLALKARTGRPLTFALKDLSLDLRVFCESDAYGRVLWRHAAPNEEAASTVRLSFTSITRSMVEENTMSLSADEDPRALDTLAGGDTLHDEDRQKLEQVGVRTVGQLRRFSTGADPTSVETYLGIPVMRLQNALLRASRPAITGNDVITRNNRRLLRVRGVNLSGDDVPEVRLSGEKVDVIEASPGELLVRPLSHHVEGAIEITVGAGTAKGFYELATEPPARSTPVVAPLGTEEGE